MITPILQPWPVKPPCGTGINWSNPLAQGLTFAVPFNEGGGLPRLHAGNLIPASTMGNELWNPQGIYNTATTWAAAVFPTSAGQFGTGDFTVLSFEITPASASYAYILSNKGPTSTLVAWWGLCANLTDAVAAGSGHYSFLTYASALTTNCGAANMLDGNPHVFVGRRMGTNHSLWRDGVKANSKTGTVRNVNTDYAEIATGQKSGSTYSTAVGTRILAAGWKRALTDAEIVSLSINPWQLFLPQRLPLVTAVTAATFSGISRGRSLVGISRGRISCGY